MKHNKDLTAGETAMQVFAYEGNPITFKVGETLYVNASQMAKQFGKQTSDWLRLKTTKDFLQALSDSERGIPRSGEELPLTTVVKGGKAGQQGTWFHEDVVMEFARWLSPKFAIWCNDRIKELLRDGAMKRQAEEDFSTPEGLMRCMMKQQQSLMESNGRMIEQIGAAIGRLSDAVGKAERISRGRSEEKTYTFSTVARLLEFESYNDFVAWMLYEGIMMQDGSEWVPTPDFDGRDWFRKKWYTAPVTHKRSPYTVVTQSGFRMIYNMMWFGNPEGTLPGSERKEVSHE